MTINQIYNTINLKIKLYEKELNYIIGILFYYFFKCKWIFAKTYIGNKR